MKNSKFSTVFRTYSDSQYCIWLKVAVEQFTDQNWGSFAFLKHVLIDDNLQ